MIEHNLDVIKCADWIIDLGPGAGVHGGEIVFTGTPEELMASAAKSKSKTKRHAPVEGVSVTASYLKEAVEGSFIDAVAAKENPKAGADVPKAAAEVEEKTQELAPEPDSSPENEEDSGDSLDPWKVLGRRWHSLGKGFPDGQQPEWPLELADAALALIESVAGDDSLAFDSPGIVHRQTQRLQ